MQQSISHGSTSNHSEDCYGCKLVSLTFATPNGGKGTPSEHKNSWEKGTAKARPGMPLLTPGTISPMPIAHYENDRQKIEEGRRAMAHKPQEA